MSSIPSLTDALKSLPAGRSEPSNFAGTGWRGLPMSTNIDDQRGQNLLETQNDETKTLIGELRRLNALSSPARKGHRARNTGHWRCPAAGALASPGRRIPRWRRPAGRQSARQQRQPAAHNARGNDPPPQFPAPTAILCRHGAQPRPEASAAALAAARWRRSGPARQSIRAGADEGAARKPQRAAAAARIRAAGMKGWRRIARSSWARSIATRHCALASRTF